MRTHKVDKLYNELQCIADKYRFESIKEMVFEPGCESLWLEQVHRVLYPTYEEQDLDHVVTMFRYFLQGYDWAYRITKTTMRGKAKAASW